MAKIRDSVPAEEDPPDPYAGRLTRFGSLAQRFSETGQAGKKEQPMEKLAQNIQEAFLNNARKEKTFLTIYLMSGVKLSGRIRSFDKYSVILETNNQEQLIFKHAISTVVVSKPFHTSAISHAPGAPSTSGPHPAPGTPASDTEQ